MEHPPPRRSKLDFVAWRSQKLELLSHQQLRCFCAAAELGSFTAAAAALGVTQPAVAQHIRKMEDLLGVDLFVRAGRGVVPTDAGRSSPTTPPAACRPSRTPPAAWAVIAMRHGVVALGTFSTPTPWRLHEVAAAFLERHPGTTVRLIGRNSSVIADRVRRGELEAALVLLPIDDAQLDVRPILRDEVLYVSASRDTRRPATVEQLASRPLVFYDAESADNDPIRRQLAERAQARGLRIRPRVEVELIETALRLVADGLGDSYLPSAYTHAPYYPDNLHTVAFSPALHDTFAFVTRPGSRLAPGLREFIDELERHMLAAGDGGPEIEHLQGTEDPELHPVARRLRIDLRLERGRRWHSRKLPPRAGRIQGGGSRRGCAPPPREVRVTAPASDRSGVSVDCSHAGGKVDAVVSGGCRARRRRRACGVRARARNSRRPGERREPGRVTTAKVSCSAGLKATVWRLSG